MFFGHFRACLPRTLVSHLALTPRAGMAAALAAKRYLDFDGAPESPERMFVAKRTRPITTTTAATSPLHTIQAAFAPSAAAEPMDAYAMDVVCRKRPALRAAFVVEDDDEEVDGSELAAPEDGESLCPRRPRVKCPPEMLFTVEQVRSIVDKAVREREAELSAQYDRALHERLAEQLDAFAKYHQTFLQSRQSSDTSSCKCSPCFGGFVSIMLTRTNNRYHVIDEGSCARGGWCSIIHTAMNAIHNVHSHSSTLIRTSGVWCHSTLLCTLNGFWGWPL